MYGHYNWLGILFLQIHVVYAQSLFTEEEINNKQRCQGPKVDIAMVMKLKEEIDALKKDATKLTEKLKSLKAKQTGLTTAGKRTSQDECITFSGFCFIFSNYTATWTEAQRACEMLGGYLAEPDSAEIDNQLHDIITAYKDKTYWLGGSDIEVENTWKWMHGEKRNFTYTNWFNGEPNNYKKEDCLIAHWLNKRKWYDYKCNKTAHFVCQKRM